MNENLIMNNKKRTTNVLFQPKITITTGDLLKQNVDVIVNAWNRNIIPWWLLLPQGVSGAIKREAVLLLSKSLPNMVQSP